MPGHRGDDARLQGRPCPGTRAMMRGARATTRGTPAMTRGTRAMMPAHPGDDARAPGRRCPGTKDKCRGTRDKCRGCRLARPRNRLVTVPGEDAAAMRSLPRGRWEDAAVCCKNEAARPEDRAPRVAHDAPGTHVGVFRPGMRRQEVLGLGSPTWTAYPCGGYRTVDVERRRCASWTERSLGEVDERGRA